MNQINVSAIVDAFLRWPLPKDFAPDGGVEFTPPRHSLSWPTGTNLLNAEQAEELFKRIIAEAMTEQAKTDNFSVVEVYGGEYHQGFKSEAEAEAYVHQRLDTIDREQDYEFRLVKVVSEWSSDRLLPGER